MKKLYFLLLALVVAVPTTALAQVSGDFVPLVGIPGLTDPGSLSIEAYIGVLYILAISIAAFLAVIKLILAGLKYILSDIVTQKADAKKDISSALIGLGIVLGAVLILTTINPQLTNLKALDGLDGVRAEIRQRVEVIPTASDNQEIQVEQNSCIARASEGYVFRVYGSIEAGRSYECCIPGRNCRYDTIVTTGDNITLDTNKIYSDDELQALRSELQATGNLLYFSDVLLSSFISEEVTRCEQQNGTPYQLTRNVPNIATNQTYIACMVE